MENIGIHQATFRRESAPEARPRQPVVRTRRVVLGELGAAERAGVSADAYALYAAYKTGVDRETFERAFFADDSTRAAFFYAEDGALAGFTTTLLQRVEREGVACAVFSALIIVDTRYRATNEASVFAIVEALRAKLREPWTRFAVMGVLTAPAMYRLLCRTTGRIYPSRHAPTPPEIHALMRATVDLRGLELVDTDRWLVRGHGAPRYPERLRTSKTLRDDPDARFYLEHNPRFDEGTAMLAWVPLDLADIAAVFRRVIARRLFGDGG